MGNLPRNTTVIQIKEDDSVIFAVATLVFYLLLYPVGLILNVVGLFTGPRQGCFLAMFLILFFVPVAIIVILVVAGVPVLAIFLEAIGQGE